jgi:hypothetical protein
MPPNTPVGCSMRHSGYASRACPSAATLAISERTVKLHRTSIKSKTGIHSAARLASLARDVGLFAEELALDT